MKWAGIALVVALIAGLFGVVAVAAQDGEDGPFPQFFGRGRGPMGGNVGLADRSEMQEAIAAELGISVEELESARSEGTPLWALVDELGADMAAVREAMESVRQAAIDQALAEGAISEEQAERLRNGRGPWRQGPAGPFYGEGPGMNLVDANVMHQAIADALGISVEELEAARAEGTSLMALAEEQGVEIEAVRAAMEAVREEAINQALAEGAISEEQAEWLLSRPAFGQGHGPLNGPCSGEGPFGGHGPGGAHGPHGNAGHGHGRGGGNNG